jgi:Phage terminase, small subunit
MPRRSAASLSTVTITGTLSRLSPPADLGEVERRLFIDLIGASKPEAFRPSDLPLLCAYCRAIAKERQAWGRLEAEGDVIDGKPSAWLAVWAQAHKSMLAFSHRLRLSPQGRSPTNPARPERPLSAYDRMDLERRGEDERA